VSSRPLKTVDLSSSGGGWALASCWVWGSNNRAFSVEIRKQILPPPGLSMFNQSTGPRVFWEDALILSYKMRATFARELAGSHQAMTTEEQMLEAG
jgi:hypothetical protein